MAGLPPRQRERTDNVHDGTTGLLLDGLLAGMDDLGSYDLADLDIRVRAQVNALVAAARELSDACADLADALRPPPGNGTDDPLTMDFARLRAERSATLLDEDASAAHGTYRLLKGAHTALDDATEPDPGPVAEVAAAEVAAAEVAAAEVAAAEVAAAEVAAAAAPPPADPTGAAAVPSPAAAAPPAALWTEPPEASEESQPS